MIHCDGILSEEQNYQSVGKTGALIFHDELVEQGVKILFGMPGGTNLSVFDILYDGEYIRLIRPKHEQGGGHMAEGYARVSGKPGVLLTTSGPSATNLVTPLHDALMDGTPIVAFTGQVFRELREREYFQNSKIVEVTKTCTKWSVQVQEVSELVEIMRKAFETAISGRPGPVLVDIPRDIFTEKPIGEITKHRQNDNFAPLSASLKGLNQVAELLNKASSPVICAGHGAIQAWKEIRSLAIEGNIPITTTIHGMGIFDETHPLSLHMLGMHGSYYANMAMQNADVIVGIGMKFDERAIGFEPGFGPAAKLAYKEARGGIIHFDISPKQIEKNTSCNFGIIGDAKENLEQLLPLIRKVPRKDWLAVIQDWKDEQPFHYKLSEDGKTLKPQQVVEELYRQTKNCDDVIITAGAGQHQMWAAQFYRWTKPGSYVSSGGFGTMGFGLPAAIGAKLAKPNAIVIDIDGDCSFLMTAMELGTATEYNIGVKVIIINNSGHGMVRQWQRKFFDERYISWKLDNVDFVKLAEAVNCKAFKCDEVSKLAPTMAEFLAAEGPTLAEFVVSPEEECYPFVPVQKSLDQMILE